MEVTYRLTPQDMWAFQQFHARKKPAARLFNGFGTVMIAFSWLWLAWSNGRRLWLWQHVFGGMPGFWHLYWTYHHTSLLSLLFYTLFAAYVIGGSRLLFLHRVRGAQAFREPVTMHLYPDALLLTTPTQHNRLAWTDIREITGNRGYLFFYTGLVTAIIVPKRAFSGTEAAFEAAARAYKSDPQATSLAESSAEVWPPPPIRKDRPVAPILEDAPDPPGTTEIAYVTRRADAWRSAGYTLLTRPSTVLSAAVPLLLSALYIAFASHAGLIGYGLALLVALFITTLLIANQIRVQLLTRFPARDSVRACTSKIRPDAFVDLTPNGRAVILWRDIGSITLFGGDLHLRRRDGLGSYFIPRSAFASPSDARVALEAMRRCQREAGYTKASNDEVSSIQ